MWGRRCMDQTLVRKNEFSFKRLCVLLSQHMQPFRGVVAVTSAAGSTGCACPRACTLAAHLDMRRTFLFRHPLPPVCCRSSKAEVMPFVTVPPKLSMFREGLICSPRVLLSVASFILALSFEEFAL